MRYVAITLTQDNLEWAFRENIRRVYEVLATKQQTDVSRPMLNVDANSFVVGDVVSVADTDACTKAKFEELQNG